QPPPVKGPKGFGQKGGAPFPRGITADEIVDRIASFDKNKTGKVTADDLPERMQHLVALGDINKDGALDKDEMRKMATALESFAGLTGGNAPAAIAKGPPQGGGPGGVAPKGKGAAKGFAGDVQRVLDDLNVTGSSRDKADRVLRAHQDKTRRFEELTRA